MRALRLSIVCSGITQSMRKQRFPVDERLEARSVQLAGNLASRLPRPGVAFGSPSARARETADILGIKPILREDLSDQNYGLWGGLGLNTLEQSDPKGLLAWMSDPNFMPPEGESLADVARRTAGFLDETRSSAGHVVAVSHAAVARAAVLHVLEAPLTAFWKIDVPPLCVLDLRFDGKRWALRGYG